jgi:hypothetical protein
MAGFFGPNASLEMNPNNEINLNNVGTAALGCPGELARRAFGEVSDLGISGGGPQSMGFPKRFALSV